MYSAGLFLLAVPLVAGCASLGGSTEPEGGDPYHGTDLRREMEARESSSHRILLRSHLDDFPEFTLREAILRFRPGWLRPRPSLEGSGNPMYVHPKVWLDNTYHEDTGVLDRTRVWQIELIRYLNPQEATNRYGGGYPAGAIVVVTRSH